MYVLLEYVQYFPDGDSAIDFEDRGRKKTKRMNARWHQYVGAADCELFHRKWDKEKRILHGKMHQSEQCQDC